MYYKNGGNNADKDSLFLILTPGANFAQFKNMSLLAGASSYGLFGWGATEKMTNGVNTPYAVFVHVPIIVRLLYSSLIGQSKL